MVTYKGALIFDAVAANGIRSMARISQHFLLSSLPSHTTDSILQRSLSHSNPCIDNERKAGNKENKHCGNGLPESGLLASVKRWGAKILATATTLEEALWLEANGVDAIIAQGTEAGGHRGNFLSADLSRQMGTFALVPQIVARVKVPVIAAGGIASAEGVSAAMKLGATGVQVGTAYLLCPEATTSPIHRAALKSGLKSEQARHTAMTNLFTGRPARGIVNRLMRELGFINPAAPEFPLAAVAVAPLRAKAESRGSGDFSPLWAGQNVTGCREIPAAELTQLMAGN